MNNGNVDGLVQNTHILFFLRKKSRTFCWSHCAARTVYSKNGICFFEKIAGAPLCHLLSWEKKKYIVQIGYLFLSSALSICCPWLHATMGTWSSVYGQDRIGWWTRAGDWRRHADDDESSADGMPDAERGVGVPVSSCIRRAAPAYKRLTSTSLHTAWTGTQPTVDRCVRCGYCLMASR